MQLSGESLDLSTEFFAIKETVDLGCYDGAELEFVAKVRNAFLCPTFAERFSRGSPAFILGSIPSAIYQRNGSPYRHLRRTK